jgi:hypothetical protein
MADVELRAFDALGTHARLADLVAITRAVAISAAEARKTAWADAAKVKAQAEELKLTVDDAATSFGNALTVLERGPEDDSERALIGALWAHAIAEQPPKGRDDEDRLATDTLWLATHTPFDATGLLDRALGDGATDIWDAIADRIRRVDQGKLPTLGRGEALIGCAALVSSTSPSAVKHVSSLATEVKDRAFARVLGGKPATTLEEKIRGELVFAPRSPVATAALALTGLLFVIHGSLLIAKLALAYKRPAEVTLTDNGVRVRSHTEFLGRKVRERDIIVLREALTRATREVRYPRLAFYAGLLALAIGSYVGVATLIDGVRAASPSLLLTGLLIIAAGIFLDLLLGSVAPGSAGRCRVLFVPRTGPALCVGGVDAKQADEALAKLAKG